MKVNLRGFKKKLNRELPVKIKENENTILTGIMMPGEETVDVKPIKKIILQRGIKDEKRIVIDSEVDKILKERLKKIILGKEDEENVQMIGGGVFLTADDGEVEEEEQEETKPVNKTKKVEPEKSKDTKPKSKKYTKGTTTKLKDSDMDGYVKKVEERKKKTTKEIKEEEPEEEEKPDEETIRKEKNKQTYNKFMKNVASGMKKEKKRR